MNQFAVLAHQPVRQVGEIYVSRWGRCGGNVLSHVIAPDGWRTSDLLRELSALRPVLAYHVRDAAGGVADA